MDTLSLERQEAEVAAAAREPGDTISIAVGSNAYSTHHRFNDLRMSVFRTMTMSSSALTVSRFYFGLEPKVVVDIVEHPERFKPEIAAKRQYCADRGYRYVLVPDEYDEDAVREQLRPKRLAATAPANARKPRTTGKPPASKPRASRRKAAA